MSNVLVTGGAGYIGSHTCKKLAQYGYTPICYDSLVHGHKDAVKWGPFELGDVSDIERLYEVLAFYKPVAVMHFAAYAYVGESAEDPIKYYGNNVSGTLCLIQAMLEHNINKLVFSSTCATYGVPEVVPIPIDHQQKPINPYGSSKLMIEKILRDCDTAYGMKSVALRYFNAAGADPDCEIGENHSPETHIIPLILDVASGRSPYITVYGNDYNTKDGTCIRDYIHVCDLAEAHVLSLRSLENGGESTAYNLGNGSGCSVLDLIKMVEKITGASIDIKFGSRRDGDPPCLIGDPSKIEKELAWQSSFSDLNKIIETAWAWHKKLRAMQN